MKMIQMQVAITLGEDAVTVLVELIGQAINKATDQPQNEPDQRREARLRASRNALFAGQKPPSDVGILIDTREAARLLKVSPRTLDNMRTTGRIPPPVKIGSAVRWSCEALKKWVEAGCPKVR